MMPTPWPTPAADRSLPLYNLLADLEPQQQFNEEQLRELRAELAKAKPALKEADRLADLPEGRYPIAWKLVPIDTFTADLDNSRSVADLLRHEASRRAHDRDMEGACRAELALINTGRSIGDEYTLIPLLIRSALLQAAAMELERVLAQGEADEKSLAAVQQLLEREDRETPAATVAALRGERALAHRMMEAVEGGELPLSTLIGPPATLRDRIGDALNPGMIRHSHAVYLRHMAEVVEQAKTPSPERLARLTEMGNELDSAVRHDRRVLLAAMLVATTSSDRGTVSRKLARLRPAIAAVAAERYRRAHGGWPESLEALAPAYLGAVPADPYDGQPLRYRRLGDGVVIYSVGPDGADNGGHLDRKDPLAEGNDLGIRLWDVRSRRQPPPPPKPREEQPPVPEGGEPEREAPEAPER
jgi:hypothetical protein